MSLSCAMACRILGAPVKLCSPAPQQEKKEPITITQGEGQARAPITGLPFRESPNLFTHDRIVFCIAYRIVHQRPAERFTVCHV